MIRNDEQRWTARPRRIAQIALGAALTLMTSGCARAPEPLRDEDRIVRAVLTLLVSDQLPICVDRTTAGGSLFAYAAMMKAPRPSRAVLAWYPPTPLRPPVESMADALAGRPLRARLLESAAGQPLPLEMRFKLDALARALALKIDPPPAVTIGDSWKPPLVTARWWLINRIVPCRPNYVLTSPLRTTNLAFVTVSAEHRATTYAVRRQAADWVPIARWSSWLY